MLENETLFAVVYLHLSTSVCGQQRRQYNGLHTGCSTLSASRRYIPTAGGFIGKIATLPCDAVGLS